ncbi:MAG: anaerobic ribonucleoside-triphosphate reductase activating protein [Thermoguttaceae bacterium]|nr:anaerobic ribonucleoside-triphosphate reductase activating protein [Thermoguttaceae bacterium]
MSSIPTDTILVAGIEPESITDGPGVRFVVFTQGCPHHCRGCHNPETHAFSGRGTPMTVDELYARIVADPLVTGVTFSGGEPLLHAGPLSRLAKKCHIDGKNVMVYTGYLYEKIREAANPDWDALLAETDILIDGPYVEAERSLAIHFRGSRNQRVFFLSERGKEYKDRF